MRKLKPSHPLLQRLAASSLLIGRVVGSEPGKQLSLTEDFAKAGKPAFIDSALVDKQEDRYRFYESRAASPTISNVK